jgi:hypothetical protein
MRGGFVAGGLLILAGIVGALLFAGLRLVDLEDRISSFPRASLSDGAVDLPAGEHNVYLDVPGGTGKFAWSLTIRDPRRVELPLRGAGGSFEYDLGGREGELVGKVRVIHPGRHVLVGDGPPGARVVFGRGLLGRLGTTLLGALAIFFVPAAVGAVLIIVAAARRRPREPKRWP